MKNIIKKIKFIFEIISLYFSNFSYSKLDEETIKMWENAEKVSKEEPKIGEAW